MPARPATGPARPHGVDELILPGVSPSNVHGPGGRFRTEGVTNDLYNIAERLKELNPRLFINILEDRAQGTVAYVIMERTSRGTEEVVFKCKTLDPRVLEHVRYLMNVPFEKRFAEAEKEIDKYEADEHERELDDLVERIGLPMLRDLRELGFLGEYEHTDAGRSRRRHGAK